MKFKLLTVILVPFLKGLLMQMISGAMWGVGYFLSEKIWKKKK